MSPVDGPDYCEPFYEWHEPDHWYSGGYWKITTDKPEPGIEFYFIGEYDNGGDGKLFNIWDEKFRPIGKPTKKWAQIRKVKGDDSGTNASDPRRTPGQGDAEGGSDA